MDQEQLRQAILQLSNDPKIQAIAATWTTASGIATVLNLIPDILGILATVMGIAFTWVMIRKGRLDAKKIKLEIRILKEQKKGK